MNNQLKTHNNINMNIDSTTLQLICNAAAETAIVRFCERQGIKIKDEISQRTAFKDYGEGNIKRWEQSGKVKSKRAGSNRNSKYKYSRAEIEMVIRIEAIMPL